MDTEHTKRGTPRKNKPGAGRPAAGTARLNIRVRIEAEQAARECSDRAGMDLGQWVSRAILSAAGASPDA